MRRLLLVLTAFLALAAVLAAPAQAGWIWPVRGEVITPYRNGSDPYAAGQHRGIDIAAAVGTTVVAAAGGEVRFAGTAGTSGLTVSVRTGDGYDTSYLHLSSIAVRAGVHVSGGARLGAVGTTGERSATAPHLHFGVREADSRYAYVDPLSLLPPAPAAPPSEAPHPAPAPAPAPLTPRPAPAPAPSGAPRPAPVPRPAPAPRAAPAPSGAPRPAPVPRGAPRPLPAPGLGPRAAPAPGGAPRVAPAPRGATSPAPVLRGAPRPAPASAPHRAPRPLPAPGRASRLAPMPRHASDLAPMQDREEAHAPASTRGLHSAGPISQSAAGTRSPGSGSGGPDLAWALACAGLLLAAGILGLTGDGRKATARSRSRLAGALRPLLGRR
jgi:Peptidase family M23